MTATLAIEIWEQGRGFRARCKDLNLSVFRIDEEEALQLLKELIERRLPNARVIIAGSARRPRSTRLTTLIDRESTGLSTPRGNPELAPETPFSTHRR